MNRNDPKYSQALATCLKMREAGSPWKEVLAATGLNYSQAWLHVERAKLDPSLDLAPLVRAATDEAGLLKLRRAVSTARQEREDSWGFIAVRCNLPEGRVRKMFEEQTSIKSRGLRTGEGGRWIHDDPRYYVGEHRRIGISIPTDLRGRPAYPTASEHAQAVKRQRAEKAQPKQAAAPAKKRAANQNRKSA